MIPLQWENNQLNYRSQNNKKLKFQDILFGFSYDGMLYQTSTNTSYSYLKADNNCEPGVFKLDTRCRYWFLQTLNDPFLKIFPPNQFYSDQANPFLASILCKRNLFKNEIYSVLCYSVKLLQIYDFFAEMKKYSSKQITVDPETYSLVYHSDLFNKTSEFQEAFSNFKFAKMEMYLNREQSEYLNQIKNEIQSRYQIIHSERKDNITLNELFDDTKYQKTLEFKFQEQDYFVIINIIKTVDKSILYPKTRRTDFYTDAQLKKQDGSIGYKIKNTYLFLDILSKEDLTLQQRLLIQQLKDNQVPFNIVVYLFIVFSIMITVYQSCILGRLIDAPIEHLTRILEMIKFDDKAFNSKIIQLFQYEQIFNVTREKSFTQEENEENDNDHQSSISYKNKQETNFYFLSEDMRILFMSFQNLFFTLNFTMQSFFNNEQKDEGFSTLLNLNAQAQHFNRFSNYRALGVCYNNMGNIHLNNLRYKEAIECYQKAVVFSKYELSYYDEELNKEGNSKNRRSNSSKNRVLNQNYNGRRGGEEDNNNIQKQNVNNNQFHNNQNNSKGYSHSKQEDSKIKNQQLKSSKFSQVIQKIKYYLCRKKNQKQTNILEKGKQKLTKFKIRDPLVNIQYQIGSDLLQLKPVENVINVTENNNKQNTSFNFNEICNRNNKDNQYNKQIVEISLNENIQNDQKDIENDFNQLNENNLISSKRKNKEGSFQKIYSQDNSMQSIKKNKQEADSDNHELYWNLFNRKFNLAKALLTYFLFYNKNKEVIWDGVEYYFEDLLQINKKYLNNKKQCTFIVNFYYISFLILVGDVAKSKQKQQENISIFYEITQKNLENIPASIQLLKQQNQMKNSQLLYQQKKLTKKLIRSKNKRNTLQQYIDQYKQEHKYNKSDSKNKVSSQKQFNLTTTCLPNINSLDSLDESPTKSSKSFQNLKELKINQYEYLDMYQDIYHILDQYYSLIKTRDSNQSYNNNAQFQQQKSLTELDTRKNQIPFKYNKSGFSTQHQYKQQNSSDNQKYQQKNILPQTLIENLQQPSSSAKSLPENNNIHLKWLQNINNNEQDSNNNEQNSRQQIQLSNGNFRQSNQTNQLDNLSQNYLQEKYQMVKNNSIFSNYRPSFQQNDRLSTFINTNNTFINLGASNKTTLPLHLADSITKKQSNSFSKDFSRLTINNIRYQQHSIVNHPQNITNNNLINQPYNANINLSNIQAQQQINLPISKDNNIQNVNNNFNSNRNIKFLMNNSTQETNNFNNHAHTQQKLNSLGSQKTLLQDEPKPINSNLQNNNLFMKNKIAQLQMVVDIDSIAKYEYSPDLLCGFLIYAESLILQSEKKLFEAVAIMTDYFEEVKYISRQLKYYLLSMLFRVSNRIPALISPVSQMKIIYDYQIQFSVGIISTCQLPKLLNKSRLLVNILIDDVLNQINNDQFGLICSQDNISFDEVVSLNSIKQIKSAQAQFDYTLNTYLPIYSNILSSSFLFENNVVQPQDRQQNIFQKSPSQQNKEIDSKEDNFIFQKLKIFQDDSFQEQTQQIKQFKNLSNKEEVNKISIQQTKQIHSDQTLEIEKSNINGNEVFPLVTFECDHLKNQDISFSDYMNPNIRSYVKGTKQYSLIKSKSNCDEVGSQSSISEIKLTTQTINEQEEQLTMKIKKYCKRIEARNRNDDDYDDNNQFFTKENQSMNEYNEVQRLRKQSLLNNENSDKKMQNLDLSNLKKQSNEEYNEIGLDLGFGFQQSNINLINNDIKSNVDLLDNYFDYDSSPINIQKVNIQDNQQKQNKLINKLQIKNNPINQNNNNNNNTSTNLLLDEPQLFTQGQQHINRDNKKPSQNLKNVIDQNCMKSHVNASPLSYIDVNNQTEQTFGQKDQVKMRNNQFEKSKTQIDGKNSKQQLNKYHTVEYPEIKIKNYDELFLEQKNQNKSFPLQTASGEQKQVNDRNIYDNNKLNNIINQSDHCKINSNQKFHQGVRKGIASFYCKNNELNSVYKKQYKNSRKYQENDQDKSEMKRLMRKKFLIYITEDDKIDEDNILYKKLCKELYNLDIELLVLQLNQRESTQEYYSSQNVNIHNQTVLRYFQNENRLAEYIFNQRESNRYRQFPLMYEHYSNNFWLVNFD